MLMTTIALAWRSRPGASLRPDSQCPQHPEQAGVQLPRTDRGVDSVDEPALNEVRPLTFDIFGTGRAAVERGGLVKAGFAGRLKLPTLARADESRSASRRLLLEKVVQVRASHGVHAGRGRGS